MSQTDDNKEIGHNFGYDEVSLMFMTRSNWETYRMSFCDMVMMEKKNVFSTRQILMVSYKLVL